MIVVVQILRASGFTSELLSCGTSGSGFHLLGQLLSRLYLLPGVPFTNTVVHGEAPGAEDQNDERGIEKEKFVSCDELIGIAEDRLKFLRICGEVGHPHGGGKREGDQARAEAEDKENPAKAFQGGVQESARGCAHQAQ